MLKRLRHVGTAALNAPLISTNNQFRLRRFRSPPPRGAERIIAPNADLVATNYNFRNTRLNPCSQRSRQNLHLHQNLHLGSGHRIICAALGRTSPAKLPDPAQPLPGACACRGTFGLGKATAIYYSP